MTTEKQKIQLKKYGNRRLYHVAEKCYITLDEVTGLIQGGCEVQVLDSKTGEDITQAVLIQLILDSQKRNPKMLFSSEVLHQLIQYQDQSVSEFFQDYLPNILQSYIDWQHQAQSHFMNWAKLGWSASQYSRDFFMPPGMNMWTNLGGRHPGDPFARETSSPKATDAEDEIQALKAKISELENRLNKPPKQG